MKKSIIALIIMLWGLMPVFGQGLGVDNIFTEYGKKDGYTVVEMTGTMLKLLAGSADAKGLENLESLRIIAESRSTKQFVRNLEELARDPKLNKLMAVKEGSQNIELYQYSFGGMDTFIMIITGGDENVLIEIKGKDIDLSQVSGLANINIGS